MLAKLWKKVLLAICIIACIFNIMSKLVNRHSLKENLESANDGETVFSIFQKDEVIESESEQIIDGVINTDQTEENTASENSTIIVKQVAEENAIESNIVEDSNENVEETTSESVQINNENSNDGKINFSDFTIFF